MGGATGVKGPKGTSGPAAAVPVARVTVGDAVQVSSSAHLVALARTMLKEVPDVRSEKVEALRTQMESEDYAPEGEAVADGLIREHVPPALKH